MMRHLCLIVLFLLAACAPAPKLAASGDLPILRSWSGDFPVLELGRLPEGQRRTSPGFIADAGTFAAVWAALRPGEAVPEIDFDEHLVLFARNLTFYNRIAIVRVTLADGVAEVLVIETMTAMPIKDRAAMSLAVVPRAGLRALRVGGGELAVPIR